MTKKDTKIMNLEDMEQVTGGTTTNGGTPFQPNHQKADVAMFPQDKMKADIALFPLDNPASSTGNGNPLDIKIDIIDKDIV